MVGTLLLAGTIAGVGFFAPRSSKAQDSRVVPPVECPSEPVDASVYWHELSLNAGNATLVHRHSGAARAGRLTGVLGPSGAGKTSLLSALAGVLSSTTEATGAIWQPGGRGADSWRRVGVAH